MDEIKERVLKGEKERRTKDKVEEGKRRKANDVRRKEQKI